MIQQTWNDVNLHVNCQPEERSFRHFGPNLRVTYGAHLHWIHSQIQASEEDSVLARNHRVYFQQTKLPGKVVSIKNENSLSKLIIAKLQPMGDREESPHSQILIRGQNNK